jgi:hypothetical protein
MIIIGGKYIKLDLNRVIDSFEKIIRTNLTIPNGKNGIKYGEVYLNNHLFDNFWRKKKDIRLLEKTYPRTNLEHLKKFKKAIDGDNFSSVRMMFDVGDNKKSNQILKSHKLSQLRKSGRCGFQAILENLGKEEIFIFGFSLEKKDNQTFYNKGQNDDLISHDHDQEFEITKEMHQKGIIDASFCLLLDDEKPKMDCSILTPTLVSIKKLLQFFKRITLINYKGDKKELNQFPVDFIVS